MRNPCMLVSVVSHLTTGTTIQLATHNGKYYLYVCNVELWGSKRRHGEESIGPNSFDTGSLALEPKMNANFTQNSGQI